MMIQKLEMIQKQLCSTFVVFIILSHSEANSNSAIGPPGAVASVFRGPRLPRRTLPTGTADLIESLNLKTLPRGVEASDGLCQNREGMADAVSTSDVAYTISDRSVASIPTAQLFPDGFPSDFSILATFRAESQSKEMLFTIYNLEGKEVMSLKIGRRVKLYYQGIETSKRQIIKFGARLADDEWHRLGISVKGNSITAIVDCKKQQNREIAREPGDTIASDGVILMAQEIEDNTFFKGQIQQLQFVPNPQAAYELCKQYIPDCTEPLPRPQQDDSMASYRGMDEDDIVNR